jgi:choline dehydrogenase-like flavoprotein
LKLPEVDVVIVGAGGGGGVAARELSQAGLSVALLERGRRQKWEETGHDELRSQRTTVLGNAFGPDDEHHVRLVKLGDDKEFHRVLPSQGEYGNVAACVGGGTQSYGAMAWRFMPQDFRMRSTYGAPEGSSLEDWPIAYADLEPYYERAEWEIGVSGKAGANPFEGSRKKAYPMPALPFNREASVLWPAARRLGWHPFPIPMAINSIPYRGRPACVSCPHCVGFACEVNAKGSTASTVIPEAIATGHCDLRTQCLAAEIVTNDEGEAVSVCYFQGTEPVEQPAKAVVIAASATETPRLLLNSRSKLHPKGLGNNNGWVGRNLQGHAYSGAWGLFERPLFDGLGPAARIALCDFNHGNPGIRGGAMIANEFIRLPYLFARLFRQPDVPRWGIEHKTFMRSFYKRSMGAQGSVQEMPVFSNGVEIDPSVKDAWGIPTVRLQGRRHASDFETGRFIAEKAALWLKEAGATKTFITIAGKGTTGGQHQAGTCRMGSDPKISVTDAFGRLHTVSNVFIMDASVHVTNGGFNPSLTIQALAFRSSEHFVKHWDEIRAR